MSQRSRSTQEVEDMQESPKRLNIYKIETRFVTKEFSGDNVADHEKTDYVRAKTLAGAKALIAERYISGQLASQDDLIALAGVAVVEKE